MMEQQTTTINLGSVALEGDYQHLLKCLALYSYSYVQTTPNVERYLKIGQKLGLKGPRVNFHCSGKPGTGNDEERARMSQKAYTDWLALNKTMLDSVTVMEGTTGGIGKSDKYDYSLHEKKVRKKEEQKSHSHEQWHVDQGHQVVDWGQVDYNTFNYSQTWTCKECGTAFLI